MDLGSQEPAHSVTGAWCMAMAGRTPDKAYRIKQTWRAKIRK